VYLFAAARHTYTEGRVAGKGGFTIEAAQVRVTITAEFCHRAGYAGLAPA